MHQTKYYIKRLKHNIGCVALAIIIFSAIIMVLQFLSCIFCRNCGNRDFYITIIGYFIAIANALLLYETLNSQKEELLADERDRLRDRFETTLFSLLNFHRKLTDEIVICNPYMNNEGLEDNNEYKGGMFFAFAESELEYISKALGSDINTEYDENEAINSIRYFEDRYDLSSPISVKYKTKESERVKLMDVLTIKFYNRKYHINDADRQRDSSTQNLPYSIFCRRWYPYYERYIRNIYYILQYICDEKSLDKEEKAKYVNFVQSQMSRYELWLLNTHSKSYPKFQEMLIKVGLIK